jgi:prevent-host-death family protein
MTARDHVSVRDLRQNLSVFLRRVKKGEALEVTERGVPVAVLTPLRRRFSPFIEQAIAEGRCTPATESHHDLPPPLKIKLKKPLSAYLDEERADRI